MSLSHIHRICLTLICLCLIFSLFPPLAVVAEDVPEDSKVEAAYIYNLENHLVLHEKNADTTRAPASTVKIMTGLIACRSLEGRLDETVTVTSGMLSGSAGRSMSLAEDEKLTVRDLLYAALCGSYNDATCAIAALAAGSVADFVAMMNEEAARLGATSTHYTNPTGLDDTDMVTTAADTARIAREAYKNDLFMTVTSTHNYTIPPTNVSDERTFTNRNALLSGTNGQYYNGWCRGMNAGITDAGGWCAVTVWERDGATNLAVVMGGADVQTSEDIPAYIYINRLLNWAYNTYAYRTVLTADRSLGTYSVSMTGTSKSKTELYVPADLSLYLPRNLDLTALTYTVTLDGDGPVAPLTAGDRVGTVSLYLNGEPVGSSPVIVAESFTRNGFLDGMASFRDYLMSRKFIFTMMCFIILLLIYLRYITGPGGRYGVRNVRRKKRYRGIKRW